MFIYDELKFELEWRKTKNPLAAVKRREALTKIQEKSNALQAATTSQTHNG